MSYLSAVLSHNLLIMFERDFLRKQFFKKDMCVQVACTWVQVCAFMYAEEARGECRVSRCVTNYLICLRQDLSLTLGLDYKPASPSNALVPGLLMLGYRHVCDYA